MGDYAYVLMKTDGRGTDRPCGVTVHESVAKQWQRLSREHYYEKERVVTQTMGVTTPGLWSL